MSMFQRFNRYKQTIVLEDGSKEKAIFTRVGRSNTSNFRTNFVYSVLLDDNTALTVGCIFTCSIYGKDRIFLTVNIRHSEQSIQATVYECNATIDIYRNETSYDDNDIEIGNSLTLIASVPVNYVTVNASMRMLDAGLLPSTTKEFRMPKCDIKELDRIVLEGENYCVDSIDETKFFGMYAVQVSFDERTLE